jgi:hypothetical protein
MIFNRQTHTHLFGNMQWQPREDNISRLQPGINQATRQGIRVVINMLKSPFHILVLITNDFLVGVVGCQSSEGITGAHGCHTSA